MKRRPRSLLQKYASYSDEFNIYMKRKGEIKAGIVVKRPPRKYTGFKSAVDIAKASLGGLQVERQYFKKNPKKVSLLKVGRAPDFFEIFRYKDKPNHFCMTQGDRFMMIHKAMIPSIVEVLKKI